METSNRNCKIDKKHLEGWRLFEDGNNKSDYRSL